MKTDVKLKEKIIAEYLAGGTSYRILGKKYGYSRQTILEWVQEFQGLKRIRNKPSIKELPDQIEALPKDVQALQKELRSMKLRNKLLEEVIRIEKEETGIDLLKKAGTKRS